MKTTRSSTIARVHAICMFAAALLFCSIPASAVKVPTVISSSNLAELYSSTGIKRSFTSGTMQLVFDGDFAGDGVRINENGSYIVVDFTGTIASGNTVYVSEISVGHSGNTLYSLWTSEDGTSWSPVADAQGVSTAGKATYNIRNNAKQVKYVFDTSTSMEDSLYELEIKGFETSLPENVVYKKSNLAKIYNPDGTMTANNGTGGFGGGAGIGHWFDGNKKTNGGLWDGGGGTWLPNLGNGGWCLIDFSSVKPEGYFVTAISISQCSDFKYSLYWSADGSTWNPVEDAILVSKIGEAVYDVNETATQIKVLLNQTGGWTVNIAEIEVYGKDPADIACTHPSYTAWTPVEGTATCLLPGVDERFCTACGERFTRDQESALGHDFVSHLLKPGKYRRFGSGYVDCTRCNWRLDFPADENDPFATMPLDLVTNRVNGTPIGRVSVKGQFNFTEITVTTTGNGPDDPNGNWGVSPVALIDGTWDWGWQNYWYSMGSDRNPHVDYVFGTEIDLAWMEISVPNETHFVRFFSVDDDTGAETELYEWQVEKISSQTVVDENTGEETTVSAPSVQRTTIRFYETPVKHLRIRQYKADGESLKVPMQISECHPWGTVKGAGDLKGEKTTLFVLR